ncbi:MAG: sulfotransferase [Lysobacterales bacterium]
MNVHQQQLLQNAAKALNQGHARTAVDLGQQLLAELPGHTDCQHILGVALISDGRVDEGSQMLGLAHNSRPQDPEILYNHASALLNRGLDGAALELFDRVLVLAPNHVSALNNRGSALLALDDVDGARQAYARALEVAPEHASSWFNLGNLERRAGNIDVAEKAYARAIGVQPDYAQALAALGYLYLSQGLFSQAIAPLERCTALDPDNADGWQHFAQALAGVNRFDHALEAAKRATVLAPDDAHAWNGLGAQLTSLGALVDSERALRKALELDPNLAFAWANLAALMELANRPEECLEVVEQGLTRWPTDAGLLLTRARLLRRTGNHRDVSATLDLIDLARADLQHQREAHFLYGQALDRQKAFAEAFDHYVKANTLAATQWQRGDPRPDTIMPALQGLAAAYSPGFVDQWPSQPLGERTPAFVVSFQRSGTTLLDTMVGAHPDALVMEELPVMSGLISHMGKYPDALASATSQQLANWRSFYWDEARRLSGHTPDANQRLIDKSPLHTMHLGLIHRLFPGAPVVFALRHPLDVVLSCFMQDFTMSGFMMHYTSVEGVAKVYDRVMTLFQQYQQILPLNLHEVRYESLVQTPEPLMQELLAFLGLTWNDAVLDHTQHAKSRGLINTPSYHQVTQPLYSSSSYRWRNYRQQLLPVMDLMGPWCEVFDYLLE